MSSAPVILVPGFWLGAWAWDEVGDLLREDGHDVTALTLPGLESPAADRSHITLSDHVAAICDAVQAAGARVVLAVHSGAGCSGYAASDRVPERIAAMVYAASAPATGALDPDFKDVEKPLPSREELAEDENLEGLTEDQLEIFRRRAVPEPGGVIRGAPVLTNDARLDIPSTVICEGFNARWRRALVGETDARPTEQVKAALEKGWAWLGGLKELRDVAWVDLPTSHWPMWSRPRDLATIIGDVAKAHSSDDQPRRQ